ncbi:MAG: flavin reductase [Prevotellaceae bacterium]|jgi:flavin reductase (DIM6/NTAB) family NADH-FMN oxidoreductase RutF|nr:flavin reductase [Prevotellaceae bacterium]
MLFVTMLVSCGIKPADEPGATKVKEAVNVKDKSFDSLFKSISPEEITDNVFKLVGKDFTVITAGKIPAHNSMTASWGGLGILFEKPTTWCFLRASRYTLELIKQEHSYTMSYFPDEYKEQVLFFGSKTGKNTDKMKETTLTAVQTPSGNTTYKEARLIIECKLTELTTVGPDDFYTPEGKSFIDGAYEEVKEYHKLVFGEITGVWVSR